MRIEIETHASEEFVDLTGRVQDALSRTGRADGAVLVYCPHTTAGITVQENTDPALKEDLLAGLEALAPRNRPWKHAEGNAHAHLKAAMLGSSCLVPVANGRLQLGRWQAIYLVEFDGPRRRSVQVKVLSA
jgi:secondary thiamine-phosphate synthase enzyme